MLGPQTKMLAEYRRKQLKKLFQDEVLKPFRYSLDIQPRHD